MAYNINDFIHFSIWHLPLSTPGYSACNEEERWLSEHEKSAIFHCLVRNTKLHIMTIQSLYSLLYNNNIKIRKEKKKVREREKRERERERKKKLKTSTNADQIHKFQWPKLTYLLIHGWPINIYYLVEGFINIMRCRKKYTRMHTCTQSHSNMQIHSYLHFWTYIQEKNKIKNKYNKFNIVYFNDTNNIMYETLALKI